MTGERGAGEGEGGRSGCTDEIVFSASALINRHLDVYEPELRDYLEERREGGRYLDHALEAIEGIADLRVLLVGDAIVDEYSYVSGLGKSWKENIITTLHKSDAAFAGGVFAAANPVAGLSRGAERLTAPRDGHPSEERLPCCLQPQATPTPPHRPLAPPPRRGRP